MSPITLSIITPCFNPGPALRACIESVSTQIAPGIEHLVQDAGSTDGSVQYLREMERQHPHLRVVSEKDSGQSNAMNRAIARASGQFLGILNADDCYESGAFAAVLPELRETSDKPLFVHGKLRVVNTIKSETLIQEFPRLNRFDPYFQAFPWNPASYFYSKSLHTLVGPYDEKDHYCMDARFLLEALPLCELRFVNKILGTYFIHPGAKTHDDLVAGTSLNRLELLIRQSKARRPPGERTLIALRSLRRNLGYQKHRLLQKLR